MIDHTLRLVLVQHRAGMNPHAHPVLGGFVDLVPMILGTVHEKSTDDTLSNVGVDVVLVNAQLLVVDIDLYSLHQSSQLLFDISCSSERPNLDEVFSTPLLAVFELHPGVKDV